MQNNDLSPTDLLLTVNEESTGKRLDIFVAESIDPMSRARAGKLIDSGAVTLAGKISRCSRRVKQGDKIAVSIPPPVTCDIEPESLDLDIVFEDEHIAIIDKPVGMVVHPSPGHAKGTLVNGLLYAMKGSLSGIGGVERPGIVHRLDKDTSGLIAVAKTDQSHQSLSDQLKSKTMGRIYIAVVHGRPKNESGIIETMIGRHPRDRKKMANLEDGGRVAISEYKTITTIGKLSVVTVSLLTGRTHQVACNRRVETEHMQAHLMCSAG